MASIPAGIDLRSCAAPTKLTADQLGRRRASLRRGGRLAYVNRGGYKHVGLYLSAGRIVHLAGEPFGDRQVSVIDSPLEDFLRGGELILHDPSPRLSYHLSCVLALVHLGHGSGDYHPGFSNCEHFAQFCATGIWRSEQAEEVLALVVDADGMVDREMAAKVALVRGWRWLEALDAVREAKRRRAEPQLYYYGEFWKGWFGGLHTRVQVRPLRAGAPDHFSPAWQHIPGAWIPGPPNNVESVPLRKGWARLQNQFDAWTPFTVGLGSLDEDHQVEIAETRRGSKRGPLDAVIETIMLNGPIGPWRQQPKTTLGRAKTFGKSSGESTLSMIGEWWVSNTLELFLRTPDGWHSTGALNPLAVPGITLSPIVDYHFSLRR